MDPGADTGVIPFSASAHRNGGRNGVQSQLLTVRAVLDLIRSRGTALRILEAASDAGSLAALPTPDEIVGVREFDLGAGEGPGENSFDCAVSVDMMQRLDPGERRTLLGRLRHAARGAVLVESPHTSHEENPLQEAIELFRELGDTVLVLSDEHLPELLMLRELGLGGGSNGSSNGSGGERAARGRFSPTLGPSRSILISIIDPEMPGIDFSALQWCCSPPSSPGRDPASLAVLPLSLEIRRLSDRLDAERERGRRAEAEAADLRAKLAELTRIASEDRAAREAAEELVEIVAAARGYRIGLALYRARAAVLRALGSMWRLMTAPWRRLARVHGGERSGARQ